jgi:hypothetical protein
LLLILLVGSRFPADARLASREVNRGLRICRADQGTIYTWKQERSGLDTRTWHYGYDSATRLTSAILKKPAEAILKAHDWQYDPGNNRISSHHE